jgi:hypothetical protein
MLQALMDRGCLGTDYLTWRYAKMAKKKAKKKTAKKTAKKKK